MALTALALAVVVLSFARSSHAQQCYYARDQPASSDYSACVDDPSLVSACCLPGDCLGNSTNICWNQVTGITYIAGCTDSAFSDPLCAGLQCGKSTQFIALAKCGDGWRCCDGKGQRGDKPSGGQRVLCPSCEASAAVPSNTIVAVNADGSASAAAAATSTAAASIAFVTSAAGPTVAAAATTATTASTGAGPTASATAAPAADDSSPTSSTAFKVGLGVGLPLGCAVIGLAAVAFVLLRRRHRQRSEGDGSTAVWQGEVRSGPSMTSSPQAPSTLQFGSPPPSTFSSPTVGSEEMPAFGREKGDWGNGVR